MNYELEMYLMHEGMDMLMQAFNSHLVNVSHDWHLCLRGRYNQTFDLSILNTCLCVGWYMSKNENRITVGLGFHMDEKRKDFFFEDNMESIQNALQDAVKYIHNLF